MKSNFSSWDVEDQKMLDTLGHFSNSDFKQDERALSVLMRRGRVLLVFKNKSGELLKGLSLYQGQSLVARVALRMIKITAVFTRSFWFLPIYSPSRDGVVKDLLSHRPGGVVSVLLGNPAHESRRAIIWVRQSQGDEIVWKVGISEEARGLIAKEAAVLASLAGGGLEIPKSLDFLQKEGYTALCIPFIRGNSCSWEDRVQIATLLSGWLEARSSPAPVELDLGRLSSKLGAVPSLFLTPAIQHGDFAAWNVLKTSSGELSVIDWEMGKKNGIPGWDLVHWLIQEARLVKKCSPAEVCQRVGEQLLDPAFSEYLGQAGWGSATDWLLGSYLVHFENDPSFNCEEHLSVFLNE
ncbi:hypothetical protein N9B06_00545 [bacterium]|nr:hypothetical protein [bacterium]